MPMPLARYALAGALVASLSGRAGAQNPDLMLTQEQRDSILKTYNNRFPIWGRKAIERGFDLPYPVGISLNLVYANQNIDITNLGLSTGSNPVQPIEIVQFKEVTAPVWTGNLRGDLWLFPFLNVYVIGGTAWVTTDVTLSEPVEFNTVVEQSGVYGALGMTATMGVQHNWLAFDINWSWTQTEKLDLPVKGRIFGIRFGRAERLGGSLERRLAYWVGTMQQRFASETHGSIALSEVIDGGAEAQLRAALPGYQQSPWYQQLNTTQKQDFDAIATGILDGDLSDVTVNYALDKATADPWNMLAGISYDTSKRWQWRAEFGFIGRVQVLLMANYRFNW
jgi:hypothetical protein